MRYTYVTSTKAFCITIANTYKTVSVLSNTLISFFLVYSSYSEFTTHHSHGIELASVLCHYKAKSDRGIDKLPVLTKDVLQHRIDPNGNETDRVAIETLLYIVGTKSGGSPSDHGPELWCGLGNGRIRMYDASTWLIDRNFNFQAKKKVVSHYKIFVFRLTIINLLNISILVLT